MEEFEEVTHKKITSVHVLKELVSLKSLYYSNRFKRFNAIPIKILMVTFFIEIEKTFQNLVSQKTLKTQSKHKKE